MMRRAAAVRAGRSAKPVPAVVWSGHLWRRPWILASTLALLALTLNLLWLKTSYMIDYDFYVWVQGAKRLQEDGIWAAGNVYKEPLLSLLLNLVRPATGGDYEQAGKVISAGFGGLAIGLFFLLAHELFGSRVLAALAAILLAVHPQVIYYNTHPFSEALYLCLILLSLFCFCRAHRGGSLVAAVGAGLALGLAFLTRIPGIASALALFGLVLVGLVVNRLRPPSAVLRFVALALGFLFLAGPYWVSIRHHKGEWRLSNKVDPNLLIREAYSAQDPAQKVENYERLLYGQEKERASAPKESGLVTSFLQRPLPVLAAYGHQFSLGLVMAHWVFPLFLVALGLVALAISAMAQQDARVRGVVYLSLLAPFFAYPLGHVELRYMLPLIPAFILLALEGARWVASAANRLIPMPAKGETKRHISLVLCAAAAAIIVVAWSSRELVGLTRRTPWSEPIELKYAGLWLKSNAPPGAVVMARKPMPAFYADRPWVSLPYTDYAGLLQTLEARGVSYLVIDEIFAGRLRPELRFLLYEPDRIRQLAELVPVHVLDERRGRAVIIYRVVRERLPSRAHRAS